MTYPELLLNLALLLLWCRIWTRADDPRAFYFNPLASSMMRATDRVLGWLRAPLPSLPDRALAGLALLLALALKALVMYSRPSTLWPVGYHVFLINEVTLFLVFALQIAGLNALIRLISPGRSGRAGQVAEIVSRPVSWIPQTALQQVAALAGIYIIMRLTHCPCIRDVLRTCVDILQLWSQCTLLAILASLVSLFAPHSAIAAHGREYAAFLLGRFSGLLVVGMLDLTPILFFYGLGFVHGVLYNLIPRFF